ncbi:MAG: hypothetical protein JNK23_13075 [Opitutaceae bacterium]|nr:hypothetical protein [Opitutaceae bacterium]
MHQLMRRLLPVLGVILAAMWLPATEHCVWEAAGVLAEACPDGCVMDSTGKDGCDTVENGAYKPVGDTLKTPAPSLFVCACCLCLHQIRLDAAREHVAPPDALFERPLDWVPTWQFVQRAALSPRAPSLMVA